MQRYSNCIHEMHDRAVHGQDHCKLLLDLHNLGRFYRLTSMIYQR